MSSGAPGRLARGRRRAEIERELLGLARKRDNSRGLHVVHDAVSNPAAILRRLGPVYMAFGGYLSTRLDLVPERQIAALGKLGDELTALPADQLGQEQFFSRFDERPLAVSTLLQTHRAELADGRAVRVTFVRSDAGAALEESQFLVAVASRVFADVPAKAMARAVQDFIEDLQSAADLTRRAQEVAAMRRERAAFDVWTVPALVEEASGPGVLVVEESPGVSLPEWLEQRQLSLTDREELARRLGACWLRHALSHGIIPCEFKADDFRARPDGTAELHGRAYRRLSRETRSHLANYLQALSAGDTDPACDWLLSRVGSQQTAGAGEELRRRFRQIVPFRDGLWRDGLEAGDMAEHAIAQCRAAVDLGFVIPGELGDFMRGLWACTFACRAVESGSDTLADVIREFRYTTDVTDAMNRMAPAQMFETMNTYAMAMMALPKRVDDALSGMANAPAERPREQWGRPTHSSPSVIVYACVVLMTAGAGVLASRFLAAGAAEGFRMFLLGAIAATVLWIAVRKEHGG